jgi:hypothetical protein
MPVKRVGKRIVEKATGKTKGRSTSVAKAKGAVRIRNAVTEGALRGQKRNRRKT